MNRRSRRATVARQRTTPPELIARAREEGYAIFTASDEHRVKLNGIITRVLAGLDDINCWDGWTVLNCMTAFIAVYGAKNKVDSLQAIPRDTYLKNCAERYDRYAEQLGGRDPMTEPLQ